MAYVIKIVHRFYNKPVKYGYYSITDTFTENKWVSRVFESRIQAVNHAEMFKHVFVEDDVYIIDAENDIGTYFSTYSKELAIINAFTKIILILLLPVLIPIEGCMRLKEYIMKLIGKEYR